jgi:hypothetical protein
MVFCPYIQEHESKLITNNVTNNNVVSKVIQKFKSYVQLHIHIYHPLALLVAHNSFTHKLLWLHPFQLHSLTSLFWPPLF